MKYYRYLEDQGWLKLLSFWKFPLRQDQHCKSVNFAEQGFWIWVSCSLVVLGPPALLPSE